MSSLRLAAAFRASWQKNTTHPDEVDKWSSVTPSIGQCAVTSLVVHDTLKGEIHKNPDFNHYWNLLPSGAFVDFTHAQFDIEEEIESRGVSDRRQLLKGERATKARTKERYEILRKSVKTQLRNLAPTIVLMSSNAQAEYLLDIIEAIGTPDGTLHHFRYELKYISRELRKLIPMQFHSNNSVLDECNTMIVYLNQKKRDAEYEWSASSPIRMARIKKCYKTGEEDHSIAHFFFEVGESLIPTDTYSEDIRKVFGQSYGSDYAILTYEDVSSMSIQCPTSEVFEEQCKHLIETGMDFANTDSTTVYETPLMVLVEGLFRRGFHDKRIKVKPTYDNFVFAKSYYILVEGETYYFCFRTYNMGDHKAQNVTLKVAEHLFNTPEEYSFKINSSYDSECCELTPAFIEQNTSGELILTVTTEDVGETKVSDAVKLHSRIRMPFEIRRKKRIRYLETFNDILFISGPIYIAIHPYYRCGNKTI